MKSFALICALAALALLSACNPPPPPVAAAPVPPAPPIYATSFTCQDGNTAVQNAVCGNQQLAALDVQLAAAFRRHMAVDALFERDQVLAVQRAWLLGLPAACNVNDAADPAAVSCLINAYQAQVTALENWPAPYPGTAAATNSGITNYVHYKLIDNKQPALCASVLAGASSALGADGTIDPALLGGAKEIAGSHGSSTGTNPQGGSINVDVSPANIYGGYQIRARSVTVSGAAAPMLDANSAGNYVETLPNGGGRFVNFASQTGDYGAIDVFTLNGQVLALLTDTVGYDSPAAPGESAVAALFTIDQGKALPACLFETFIMPPPLTDGTFAEQPSLTPFLALVDTIAGPPPADFASSDRADSSYFTDEDRWTMLNMPLLTVNEAKNGRWIGWLRARHDQVLDALFAWSQKSPDNQAAFNKLFNLLRPAASDLETVYVQQQGLTTADAEQAAAIAMMESLYQAAAAISPGLGGGPADPANFQNYKPRYPILASPQ